MCSKFIIDSCEHTLNRYNTVNDTGKVLVIHGAHDKYLGDAGWKISTVTRSDGSKHTDTVVHDHHNIEKSILLIRHRGDWSVISSVTREVRRLLDNEKIPESLVRTRWKSMQKHGFLTDQGEVSKKGYEAMMVIRGEVSVRRNMPDPLRSEYANMGTDLQRCEV